MPAARKSSAKPGSAENPVAMTIKADAAKVERAVEKAAKTVRRKAYVVVDLLSHRPHPLPRGTEVSELLEPDHLKHCLETGTVSHDPPDDAT